MSATDYLFGVYSWQSFIEWINGGAGVRRCTVLQRNSMCAGAMSVLDELIAPAVIAPPGLASNKPLLFPQTTYYGPLARWNMHPVPVLGSFPLSDLPPSTPQAPVFRASMALALWEALRNLSLATQPTVTRSTTAPAGRLLNTDYPAGVVAVEGIGASLMYPYERQDGIIEEPEEATLVAKMLAPALLMADAATGASISNQNVDAAFQTSHAALAPALKQDIKIFDQMATNAMNRRQKIAGGFALAAIAAAFAARWALKERKGKDAVLQIGKAA